MKKLTVIIGIMMMALAPIAGNLVFGSGAAYANAKDSIQEGLNVAGGSSNTMDFGDVVNNVISILLFLVGALSVIFIIVAGVYYVTSNGNAEQVKRAKNTLTYAIVGLVVSILAYAIVNFVIASF